MPPEENAVRLRACGRSWTFPRPTLIAGVVNATPDSFSDGGRFLDPSEAVDRARALIEEGADWIDVGGESTRPGAAPVDEAEELRRVLPVIEELAGTPGVAISVDTRKPGVARRAIEAGAVIVNDVGASARDPAMAAVLRETGAGYVLMHMQGDPSTMQQRPQYGDVVGEVRSFFEDHLAWLRGEGVADDQVVLDVGIGFGKTLEHNLQLLAALVSLRITSRPQLLGVSRKSFIGKLTGASVEDRLPGSLAGAVWAVFSGVEILRVHDVAATRQAVCVAEAVRAHRR